MALVGIYDADGSVRGELRYLLAKLRGRTPCVLCDITHGWNPRGARSWKRACARSAVELELAHRDEASAAQLAAAERLPCVVQGDGEAWVEVVSTQELATFRGAPDALLARLAQSQAGA
ncbi:MAG TPA: hypothetical protein DEP66_01370 [Acidimicrobiaceae bacterium]|nr:hypothetical protein [Acidimicrobiaceae bacterium]HCB36889.1 hypothetical protein [Acidimicrobiaceae bacterium]